MTKYKFIMYAPTLQKLSNSCLAESKDKIAEDYFIKQLLDSGWKLGKIISEQVLSK